jgi:Cytochrome P460
VRSANIGIGDQGAEIVPDADRPLAAQGGADGPDVGRLRALVIAVGGVRGEAHAAPVGHHHGRVRRERRRQGRPHVAGGAEAVQQHARRPQQFPDGSMQQPSGRGYFPGAMNGADVTVKDTKRYADTGGWGYFNFNHHEPKAETAKVRPNEECHFCHVAGAKKDFVWTQFYRELDN